MGSDTGDHLRNKDSAFVATKIAQRMRFAGGHLRMVMTPRSWGRSENSGSSLNWHLTSCQRHAAPA
jgi:hypothetical protein